jgi:hypothetical protein
MSLGWDSSAIASGLSQVMRLWLEYHSSEAVPFTERFLRRYWAAVPVIAASYVVYVRFLHHQLIIFPFVVNK